LFEFEINGGVNKVLTDLYEPNKMHPETDSVY